MLLQIELEKITTSQSTKDTQARPHKMNLSTLSYYALYFTTGI